MCFRKSYEYTYEYTDAGFTSDDVDTTCQECERTMPAGAQHWYFHGQECELCQTCGHDDSREDEDDVICECEEPDYGNVDGVIVCMDCHRFLQAVEAAEIGAGCSHEDAAPYLTRMVESIRDMGREEAERYWTKARETATDLQASGYLDWLHAKVFK